MKKVLFVALMTVCAQGVFAQINKGQWLVGGNAGFDSEKQDERKLTTVSISPNAGYFIINNLAAGLRVDFTSVKPKDVDALSTFSVAPFVRYYFLPAAQKVNVFADASYGFGSGSFYTNEEGTEKESESLNSFAFTAGPAIFLSPSVALELGVYYKSNGGKYVELKGGSDDRENHFGLNIGFQVHLGGKK